MKIALTNIKTITNNFQYKRMMSSMAEDERNATQRCIIAAEMPGQTNK
jgi:hypothetical protein